MQGFKLLTRARFAAALVSGCLGLSAHAAPIAIANHSFEAQVLNDGDFTTPVTGWTGLAYAYNPPSQYFSGNAPDGQNVALLPALNGSGAGISQTLSATLAADTLYTLTFEIGRFEGFELRPLQVDLTAGENRLISEIFSTGFSEGVFKTVTLTFQSTASTLGLGQTLKLSIVNSGSSVSGQAAAVDNFRLDAISIVQAPVETPEPAALALLGLGVLGIAASRRRRS